MALVNSSSIKTSGNIYTARAMAILCFSPPEKFILSTPIIVSIPFSVFMVLSKLEIFELVSIFFYQ